MPRVYDSFLQELKDRIRSAQIRAALSVNRELVVLYWSIGRDILIRQKNEGWGAKIIDRLSEDLAKAFPEMRGFRARNLKYMRAFAEAYPDQEVCATGCCTIAMGSSGQDSGQRKGCKAERMVHSAGSAGRLESECPGPPD